VKRISGGQYSNVVPDYCEAEIILNESYKEAFIEKCNYLISSGNLNFKYELSESSLILKSYGTLAHSSIPQNGFNAISQLMMLLSCFDIQGDIGDFLSFYSQSIGMDFNGALMNCNFEDDISGILTFNVGTINYSDEQLEMSVDIRYPVKVTYKQIINQIESVISKYNIGIDNMKYIEPLYVSEESVLVKTLVDAYSEFFNQRAKPVPIGFRTYAYMLPNAVAFGPCFPKEEIIAHKKDEYISVKSLLDNTKIYARAIYKLASRI
jgi:succinyl-diaminopimelate desuccinylase